MIQLFKGIVICLLIALFIGTETAFTLSEKVQDNQVVTGTCNASQFDQESICVLNCTFPNTDDAYTLNSCSWKYYSTNETVAVTLYNEETSYDDGTDIVVSFTLSTYHPGFYQCELNITDQNSNSSIYIGAMNISDANPGVSLNEECTASTDCFALNSVCNETCQCTGAYNITFTSDDNTPACLTHQNEFSHCNIEEECIAENEDFLCENTVCTCEGTPTPVAEEGRQMCLDSAYLTTPCVYDEQCTLFDLNAFCNAGVCDCSPGYCINEVDPSDFTSYICAVDTTQPAPTTESTAATTVTTTSTSTQTPTTVVTTVSSTKTETTTSSPGTTTLSPATTTANTGTTTVNTVTYIPVPTSHSMSGGAITGIIFAVLIGCGLIGAIGYTAFNKFQNRS